MRIKWRRDRDDAADLTQEFFARAFEKGSLGRFDAGRARFRTFLRVCLDGFVANEDKAARRLKRAAPFPSCRWISPPRSTSSLHPAVQGAGPALIAGSDDDALFRQEWVRALFADAVAALRESCEAAGKSAHFAVFQRYDLDDDPSGRPTYAQIGADLGLPVTQVTNYLAFARREPVGSFSIGFGRCAQRMRSSASRRASSLEST